MSIILVIDEHGIYRRGLCSFIETHLPNSRAVEASNFDFFEADAFVDLILIGIEQVCIDLRGVCWRITTRCLPCHITDTVSEDNTHHQ